MLHRHHHGGFAVEGHPSGHHLIHDDTQGIDVALGVAVTASGLLRGSIMHGTHGVRSIRIGGNGFCDAEIRHLHLALPGNNDILGLNVPMYNLIVVGNLQARSHLNGDAGRLFDGQPALFLDISLEGDALHQFHDDIENILLVAHVIDIDDIRVGQRRSGLGLLLELADKIFILHKFILQYFYRHKTVQLVVLSLENLSHAAGSNFFQNLVAIS